VLYLTLTIKKLSKSFTIVLPIELYLPYTISLK